MGRVGRRFSALPEERGILRFWGRVVTVPAAVLIGGVLVVIGLLVTCWRDTGPDLPRSITLPDGTDVQAFTQGRGWYGVVTGDNQILIFDQISGKLRQTIQIE